MGLVGLVVASVAAGGPAFAASSKKGDDAIEKRAVLKKSDLPSGWTSRPASDAQNPDIPACAGMNEVSDALEPQATKSPDFSKSDLTLAGNFVVVLKTTKKAKGFLEPYRDPDALTCLETLVKEAFSNPSIASLRVYVSPSDDKPRGADEAVSFQIQVTATTAATAQEATQTEVLYYDLLVARVGRALTNFRFLQLGEPLPEQGELVDAVIGRLQSADV